MRQLSFVSLAPSPCSQSLLLQSLTIILVRGGCRTPRSAPTSVAASIWSETLRYPEPTREFRAESDDNTHATATVQRLVVPDGVRVGDVREQGLVGTFFQPLGPHPAV